MAIQYVIDYVGAKPSYSGSGASLSIGLAFNSAGDYFYGKHDNTEIAEIHIIHSETDVDDFVLTGTAAEGNPVIRSVKFAVGGDPKPLTADCYWEKTSTGLEWTFVALPVVYAGGEVTWTFGEYTGPPTKLKVVVKRQTDTKKL